MGNDSRAVVGLRHGVVRLRWERNLLRGVTVRIGQGVLTEKDFEKGTINAKSMENDVEKK